MLERVSDDEFEKVYPVYMEGVENHPLYQAIVADSLECVKVLTERIQQHELLWPPGRKDPQRKANEANEKLTKRLSRVESVGTIL